MRGIIALGGRRPQRYPEDLRQLAAIGADSGFDFLWEEGFDVTVVLGDFDSTRYTDTPAGVLRLRFPPDKDESDAELAFRHARERMGWTEWVVIGGSGERVDHFLALLHLAVQFPEWREWWLEQDHGILLPSRTGVRIPSEPGQRISLLPLGLSPPRVKALGLRWPVEGLDWSTRVSLSNEATADRVDIYCEEGGVIIIRSLEVALEFRL